MAGLGAYETIEDIKAALPFLAKFAMDLPKDRVSAEAAEEFKERLAARRARTKRDKAVELPMSDPESETTNRGPK